MNLEQIERDWSQTPAKDVVLALVARVKALEIVCQRANTIEQSKPVRMHYALRQHFLIPGAVKCELFDKLYASAVDNIETMARNERVKDMDHYTFESVIDLVAEANDIDNKAFWAYYSEISEGNDE